MRKRLRLARSFAAFMLLAAVGPSSAQLTAGPVAGSKLGPSEQRRASLSVGRSRVIVRTTHAAALPQLRRLVEQTGGTPGRQLPLINGLAASIPNAALNGLARNPFVARIALDRAIAGAIDRTGATVGATAVREALGYDGAGIGVAVIDSGVTPSHDDLTGSGGTRRVTRFVDFTGGSQTAYDDYGHGTHVAGIIAGNGFDSGGLRTGVAPAAHLIVLKVLDARGTGRISDVIAALSYVVDKQGEYNIRVVNLSLASGVYQSYEDDPLTLATKLAVARGMVVVAAAGNAGRNSQGVTQYGGVTAPGNAPWVLTVGASSHMGSTDPADDVLAPFSSHGPTAVDYAAKPDIVAPGVGIESLSAPESALYARLSAYLLSGTVPTAYLPYLSLSGTSMAAPVVTGTVALMLQANPALTPNAVKAILQFTSRAQGGADPLTQGAGVLNAKGAVELARYFAGSSGSTGSSNALYPSSPEWSARILWGNQLVTGGRLTPAANAWSRDVTWGAATTPNGANVAWGEICLGGDCLSGQQSWSDWETSCSDAACSVVTWGAGVAENVVWGSTCGGANCEGPWSINAAGSAILAGSQAATVVWGSTDGDTVVWGSEGDTVVWGSTVVWGASCSDPACEPVIWKRP